MTITPVEVWFAIGIILILMEFTTIPGIGFLFLGLGSMTSSIIMFIYPFAVDYQLATLGFSALIWFLLLWWPLKIYVYKNTKGTNRDYFDLVGMEVEVAFDEIKPGEIGKVFWSGTTMNARLHNDQEASVGDKIYVIKVMGNILICSMNKNDIH